MFNLFLTLTSYSPIIRKWSTSYDTCCLKMISDSPTPHDRATTFARFFSEDMNRIDDLKLRLLDLPDKNILVRLVRFDNYNHQFIYSYKRWRRVAPKRDHLPFLLFINDSTINSSKPLIRTLDVKPGLADITRETSRIKCLRLPYNMLFFIHICMILDFFSFILCY